MKMMLWWAFPHFTAYDWAALNLSLALLTVASVIVYNFWIKE